MRKFKGFTLIEVMVVLIMIGILSVTIISFIMNTPGKTQSMAKESMHQWLNQNSIQTQRASCAPDSDNDGYGSCTVLTDKGEKIYLQCVSSPVAGWTGASGCKEVDTLMKISR